MNRKMKLILIVFSLLTFIFSCFDQGNSTEESIEPSLSTETGIETEEATNNQDRDDGYISIAPPEHKKVAAQGLRLRENYNLDSAVVASLDEGTRLLLHGKRSEQVEIQGNSNYWCDVSVLDASGKILYRGWVFGQFINDYFTYPVDGEILQPDYPDMTMMIFGYEAPFDVPEESLSNYDYDNSMLIVKPPRSVTGPLEIQAIDPLGKEHQTQLDPEAYQLITQSYETGEIYETPYLGFSMTHSAAFPSGIWKISVYDENGIIIEVNQEILSDRVSLSLIPFPSPFDNTSFVTASIADHVYLFGNMEKPSQDYHLVLYRITEEWDESGGAILKPWFATKAISNEKGLFQVEIVIGTDLRSSDFKAAYGENWDQLILQTFGFYLAIR